MSGGPSLKSKIVNFRLVGLLQAHMYSIHVIYRSQISNVTIKKVKLYPHFCDRNCCILISTHHFLGVLGSLLHANKLYLVYKCSTLNVLFSTQMPSLIAATLATEKPTDGYLVNDITSIHKSSIPCSVICKGNVYLSM